MSVSDVNIRFLGTVPEQYDRYLGPVIFAPYAADLARRVAPVGGEPVLEIACGTGILTEQLNAFLAPDIRLVATDLNQPMIDYARSKIGDAERIEWRRADASALPFPDGSFSVVACQFGLMFVPDKEAALHEARRVLVRAGQFVFNVWDSHAYNAFGRIAHETIGSFFSVNPPDFYEVPFGFHDVEELRRLLRANHFVEVDIESVSLENRSPSAREFAVGLVKGNPVAMTIEERGVALDSVVDAVAAALAREGGDQPFRSTMRALVVSARAGEV